MRFTINQPLAIHELGHRLNQEDSLFPAAGKATTESRLFLVCDGMGGHERGEVASQTVCSAIADYVAEHTDSQEPFTREMLGAALSYAYQQLDAKDAGEEKKPGTTLTLLYLHRGGCMAAHIGDSRIYHIRPSKKEIIYKSRDHSLVYDLYEAGELTEEELQTSPKKNIITRCMMPRQTEPAEPDVAETTDIEPGDYFYLCTDGMLEQMNDEQLLSIICDQDETDVMKAATLMKRTADNQDNHSAYLIHILEVTKEQIDEAFMPGMELNPVDINEESSIDQAIQAETSSVSSQRSRRLNWIMAALVIAILGLVAAFFLYRQPQKSATENKALEEIDAPKPQPTVKAKSEKVVVPAKKTKENSAKKAAPSNKKTEEQSDKEIEKDPLRFDGKKEEANKPKKGVKDFNNKLQIEKKKDNNLETEI